MARIPGPRYQPHTGSKHIYSELIPAAITDTSFCLSRSCCCCFHKVRSSISASAYRKHFIINISKFRNHTPDVSLQLYIFLLLKIKMQLLEDCSKLEQDVQHKEAFDNFWVIDRKRPWRKFSLIEPRSKLGNDCSLFSHAIT